VTIYAYSKQKINQKVKQTLANTREFRKKYYNRMATEEPNIIVGDLVMLNARNIHTKGPSKKLSSKLDGPFKVLERKESRAYKLEISPRGKIHPVFHVSL